MTIFEALGRGIRHLNSRKRIWFLFYGVTTIWAVAVVAPVMALLFASLSESTWARQMAGRFDLQWVAELLLTGSTLPLAPLMAAGIAVLILAGIAHLFLLGGAIQLFCENEDFSLAAFFHGCGRHFWRFVRLALVSVLFYAVVGIVNSVLQKIGNKVWGEGSEQTPLIYWSWFRVALMLALYGLVILIFDYARIRLVVLDNTRAFRAAIGAVRFVFRNFRRTAGLALLVWLMLLAILAVYYGLSSALAQPAMGTVLLLLIVRQLTVLTRIWTQLLFYSSGAEMYQALSPPVVVQPEQVPQPVVAQAISPASVPGEEGATP